MIGSPLKPEPDSIVGNHEMRNEFRKEEKEAEDGGTMDDWRGGSEGVAPRHHPTMRVSIPRSVIEALPNKALAIAWTRALSLSRRRHGPPFSKAAHKVDQGGMMDLSLRLSNHRVFIITRKRSIKCQKWTNEAPSY